MAREPDAHNHDDHDHDHDHDNRYTNMQARVKALETVCSEFEVPLPAAARPGFVVTAAKPSQDPDSLPTRPMQRPGQPQPGQVRRAAAVQWYMQPWVWGLALGMLGAMLVVIAILTQ